MLQLVLSKQMLTFILILSSINSAQTSEDASEIQFELSENDLKSINNKCKEKNDRDTEIPISVQIVDDQSPSKFTVKFVKAPEFLKKNADETDDCETELASLQTKFSNDFLEKLKIKINLIRKSFRDRNQAKRYTKKCMKLLQNRCCKSLRYLHTICKEQKVLIDDGNNHLKLRLSYFAWNTCIDESKDTVKCREENKYCLNLPDKINLITDIPAYRNNTTISRRNNISKFCAKFHPEIASAQGNNDYDLEPDLPQGISKKRRLVLCIMLPLSLVVLVSMIVGIILIFIRRKQSRTQDRFERPTTKNHSVKSNQNIYL